MALDFSTFANLSDYVPQVAPAPTPSGYVLPALKSGGLQAASSFASAVAAGAKAIGYDTGAANAQANAEAFAAQSKAAGRSDIDAQGFTGNGVGGFFKKAGYEALKSLPTLAGTVALGAVAPEAVVPEALSGLLGGTTAARGALGAAGVMVPQSIGGIYDAAAQQPGGASQGDALKSIGLGLPIGLAQSVVPAGAAAKVLGGYAPGGLFRGLVHGGLEGAAAGAVGSGLQAAAESAFQPGTVGDHATAIVQAAVQGAGFGGFFGGSLGLLHGSATNKQISDALAPATDTQTGQPAAPAPAPEPAPQYVQQELPLPAQIQPGEMRDIFAPAPAADLGTRPRGEGVLSRLPDPQEDPAGFKAMTAEAQAALNRAPKIGETGATETTSPVLGDLLSKNNIGVGPKGVLRNFVDGSTATDTDGLRQEVLSAIDKGDRKLLGNESFMQIAKEAGVVQTGADAPSARKQFTQIAAERKAAAAAEAAKAAVDPTAQQNQPQSPQALLDGTTPPDLATGPAGLSRPTDLASLQARQALRDLSADPTGPAPEPVQGTLDLTAPPAPGSLFADGTPANLGTPPRQSLKSAYKNAPKVQVPDYSKSPVGEVAPDSNAAAAAPTPDLPPDPKYIQDTASTLKVGRTGALRDFFNASKATGEADLKAEVQAAIDRGDKVTGNAKFHDLAAQVGVLDGSSGVELKDQVKAMRKAAIDAPTPTPAPEIADAVAGAVSGPSTEAAEAARSNASPEAVAQVPNPSAKESLWYGLGDDGKTIANRGAMREFIKASSAQTPDQLKSEMTAAMADPAQKALTSSANFKRIAMQLKIDPASVALAAEAKKPAATVATLGPGTPERAVNSKAMASQSPGLASLAQRIKVTGDSKMNPVLKSKALKPRAGQEAAGVADTGPARPQMTDAERTAAQAATAARMIDANAPAAPAESRTSINDKTGGVLKSKVFSAEAARRNAEAGQPASISDRIMEAAHAITGETGGKVQIADLRKALPDIDKADFESALKRIHADDSDTELVKNPEGQRAKADGIALDGVGKVHALSIEPRGGNEAPAAAEKAIGQGPYPGDVEAAKAMGITLPTDKALLATDAYTAVSQRLQLLWNKAGKGQFDGDYQQLHRDAEGTFGDPAKNLPRDNSGDVVTKRDPFQEMMKQKAASILAAREAAARDKAAVATAKAARPIKVKAAEAPAVPKIEGEYPGMVKAGKALGVTVPSLREIGNFTKAENDKFDDFAAKLKEHWADAAAGKIDDGYRFRGGELEDSFGNRHLNPPKDPNTGTALKYADEAEQAAYQSRIDAAQGAAAQPAADPRLTPEQRAVAPQQTPEGRQLPREAIGASLDQLPEAFPTPPDDFSPPEETIKPKMTWGTNEPGDGYTSANAKADIADILSKIKPEFRDRVKIVNDADGFNDRVKSAADRGGLDLNLTPGLYHEGQVHINADAMKSRADVEDIISHEVFGHLASEQRTGGGDAHESALASIYDRTRDGLMGIARKYGILDSDGRGGRGLGLQGYMDGIDLNTTAGKAKFVDEVIAHAASSTEVGRMQRGLLAIVGNVKQAIASTLRKGGLDSFAKKFETFTASDLEKWLQDNRTALTDEKPPANSIDLASLPGNTLRFAGDGKGPITSDEIRPKLIRDQEEQAQSVSQLTGSLLKVISGKSSDIGNLAMEKLRNNLSSKTGLARMFDRDFGGLMNRDLVLDQNGQAINARVSQLRQATNQNSIDYKRKYPKAGAMLEKVLARSTELQLDPRKRWEDHGHLLESDNVAGLKSAHAELVQDWNKLGQNFGGAPEGQGQKLFNDLATVGRSDNYMRSANLLHAIGDTLGEGQGLVDFPKEAPGSRYAGLDPELGDQSHLHNDVNASEQFFKNEMETRVKSFNDYLMRNADNPSPLSAEIKQALDLVKDSMTKQDQSPYFSLGRTGDYFNSFKIKLDPDTGRPAAESVKAIMNALEKNGFNDVSLHQSSANDHFFMRGDSQSAMDRMNELLRSDLSDHLSEEPSSGKVNSDKADKLDLPAMRKMVQMIENRYAGSSKEVRDALVNDFRAMIVDAMPDNALVKTEMQREGKQGYRTNMLENIIQYGQTQARATANTATKPEQAQNAAKMQRMVKDSTYAEGGNKAVRMANALEAYQLRNAAAATRNTNNFLSTVRNVTHSFNVGLSPGYMVMQLSQLGTLTAPTLAKKHSWGSTGAAMLGTIPDVTKIVGMMAKNRSLAITPDMLRGAGLSAEKVDHVMGLVNRGAIDLSTYTQAMSAEPGVLNRLEKFQHFANGSGVLSEVAARLSAALAAKKLYDANPAKVAEHSNAIDYAHDILSNSMFNWGSYDTPRIFSSGGPLGAAAPTTFQFHQFGSKMAELLLNETAKGFLGKAGSAAEAAESRRFMYAHGAAALLVAGSLGLPAAGFLSGALTRLTGLFNDGEAYDVQAHYREFLASMFGKDVGSIVAKGLPQYLGLDLSDLGDASLVPFTRLIEDRRKFEDAMPSYLASAWGSSVGAASNVVLGLRDLAEGRPSVGMARMLPTAMRNVAKAYRLNEYGYVNSQGEKMPLDASSLDVLKQALGFETGEYADAKDKERSITAQKEDRSYHSGVIKQNLAVAMENGDTEGVQKWYGEATKYDLDPDHIGEPMSQTIGPYLAQRRQAQAYAKATGRPLGLAPTNLSGLNLVGF